MVFYGSLSGVIIGLYAPKLWKASRENANFIMSFALLFWLPAILSTWWHPDFLSMQTLGLTVFTFSAIWLYQKEKLLVLLKG